MTVSRGTAKIYATCLDRHLMPRLGEMAIRDIEPSHVLALQRGLRDDGVGDAMAQKVLVVLSGIMRHSQLLGRVDRNPVGPVRIPQPRRKRAIRPLAPEVVERMRADALVRGHVRDAALLSLMTYAGLRPGVRAGWNPLEIAVEMGNSPEVVQRDYSHLSRELARGERARLSSTPSTNCASSVRAWLPPHVKSLAGEADLFELRPRQGNSKARPLVVRRAAAIWSWLLRPTTRRTCRAQSRTRAAG